jgi:hypothetical protein
MSMSHGMRYGIVQLVKLSPSTLRTIVIHSQDLKVSLAVRTALYVEATQPRPCILSILSEGRSLISLDAAASPSEKS